MPSTVVAIDITVEEASDHNSTGKTPVHEASSEQRADIGDLANTVETTNGLDGVDVTREGETGVEMVTYKNGNIVTVDDKKPSMSRL